MAFPTFSFVKRQKGGNRLGVPEGEEATGKKACGKVDG